MIAWLSVALAADPVPAPPAIAAVTDQLVLGDVVYPVSGPAIENGAVLLHEGKIIAVGPASTVSAPPGATTTRGKVVTPGFVDGLSVIGLTGPLNKPFDQDHAQPGEPVRSDLRAVDAYDPWDELVAWVRAHGVTTVQAGPSPGVPVGARSAIVSTAATANPVLVPEAMAIFTLGEAGKEVPGAQTRMGSAAEVRQALTSAREYRDRRKLPLADRPEVDLREEALVQVLDGKLPAVFVAHRADDLLTALRLGDEFHLRVVLAGATEAYLVRDAIAAAKVPVLVGPVMARQWSNLGETHDGTFENAALLDAVGIPIGLMTGYESYVPKVRVVGWEAAVAAANGLGRDRALEVATLGTARILGVGDRKGSLEVGKDADVVVFDGDPFEYVTHVCAVFVMGKLVSDHCE